MNDHPTDGAPAQAGIGLPGGQRIGKYEILQRLGVGGQALVYQARDVQLGRLVALKQISTHLGADERFVKRFREEAKILARLGGEQSNIVAVYDLIEHELGLFIAMEYVEGHSLAEVLNYQKLALPPQTAIDLLGHIANGLAVAHRAGIVHRDIKPGNIIVTRTRTAKIADFGVAAQAGAADSLALGTTKYMAPEAFSNAVVDARADIYSLGFLAYEMLTGREFFDRVFADVVRDRPSENVRWMKWHADLDRTAPRLDTINPRVSAPLADCIARMMAKDPDRRYATIDAVIADLKAVRDRPAPAPALDPVPADLDLVAGAADALEELPTETVPRRPLPVRVKVLAATAVLSVLLLIGSILAVSLTTGHRDRRQEAAGALEAAMRLYRDAADDYHRAGQVDRALAGFRDAQASLRKWADRYGDLPEGTVGARAWERMSQAYEAMLVGDWEQADTHLEEARKLGALDRETVVDAFAVTLSTRRTAVGDLDDLTYAVDAEDFERADLIVQRLGDLQVPRDQQDRLARLTAGMTERRKAYEIRRSLEAGDAALANAETAAAVDRIDRLNEARAHLDQAEMHYKLAQSRGDTPEVRQRLLSVRLARGYIDARANYIAAVVGGAPLAEQVKALQAVVDARPPTEALRDRLASAQAEEAWQRAAPLLESDRPGDLEAARDALAASVGYKPLPKAVEALAQVSAALEHGKLVADARAAMDEGRWAQAIEWLQQAQTLEQRGAAESIRRLAPVADALSDARVGLHLSTGDQARRAQRWAEALADYERARKVRPQDAQVASQVDQRVGLVEREKQFYAWVDEGRRCLEAEDYRQAVTLLNRAYQAGSALEVPLEAVTEVRQLARYRWEVAKGRTAEADGSLREALGYYRVARDLMDTDEVRKLIEGVIERVE
ncbi:MAG: protein kinase [Planctomycetes bacterium]|nr:protein kinase [Planctomycetota bacterium]